MDRQRVAFGLLLVVGFAGHASGQPAAISPTELVRNGDRFDGHRVTVKGSITHLSETSAIGRPSYLFDLGDGTETIRVIAFGAAPCRAGEATVAGTFQKVKAQLYVTATKVTCQSQDSN